MANLAEFLRGDRRGKRPSMSTPIALRHEDPNMAMVVQWIQALQSHETREEALQNLVKHRGMQEDMAVILWNSFGTISALLQEVISVYRVLSSAHLTEKLANRVSNALVLLQCVAAHPDTKMKFLQAGIPMYLYPFLNTREQGKPHEYLRLTSLGVIGALVKENDAAIIHTLLESQVFPCCLMSTEAGGELSKMVATFILQKILIQDEGLKYCCALADRVYALCHALGVMLNKLPEEPSEKLLKLIIGCYLRLSDNPRACDGLPRYLPIRLADSNFVRSLSDDPSVMHDVRQLLYNITIRRR